MQLREFVYEPHLYQSVDAHDHSSLSLIVGGSFQETAEQTQWSGGAGHVILKPRDVVHDDLFGARGARTFTLILDSNEGRGPLSLVVRRRAGRAVHAGGDGVESGSVLRRHRHRSHGVRCRGCLEGRTLPNLAEVARRIATTDVPVSTLARELSMHPVALARAVRRECGCSLTAYRRRARIRRATDLLSQTRVQLADVALESGFSDQSHLCRYESPR